jgi:hypothetical protein
VKKKAISLVRTMWEGFHQHSRLFARCINYTKCLVGCVSAVTYNCQEIPLGTKQYYSRICKTLPVSLIRHHHHHRRRFWSWEVH